MKTAAIIFGVVLVVLIGFSPAAGQASTGPAPTNEVIPPHAKVFIAAMLDGFDQFLKDAIERKKVPLHIVADKDQADFQITGQSETQNASTAKKVITWDGGRTSRPASR